MTRAQFSTAYLKGFSATVRLLRRLGADGERARDLAQDAWMRAWLHLHQLKDDKNIYSWANRIAVNLMWSAGRRHEPVIGLEFVAEPTNSSDLAERILDKCLALDALAQCSPKERAMLDLKYQQEFSTAEIAQRLGSSTVAISAALARLRRRLRDAALDRNPPRAA